MSSNSFNPASFLKKPTATQYGTENFAEYGVEGFFFIGFAFQEYILLVGTMIFVGFFGTYFGKKVLISKGKHYFQKVLTIILLLGGIRIIYLGLQNLNLL